MYLWIKALHLIFVVSWFAGLFYIFRLFVYHVKYKDNKEMSAVYSQMEHRLIFIIMYPAMVLTIMLGLFLAGLHPAVLSQSWFLIKFLLVIVLIGYHIFSHRTASRFLRGDYFLTEKQCRLLNEVPTLLLIAIVILAVVRP